MSNPKSFLSSCVLLIVLLFLGEIGAAKQKGNGSVYIVYMGSSRNSHVQLMTSMIERNEDRVLYTYTKGFTGFAARLSEDEAKSMAETPGVVSVFPDRVYQLHTTRSWDFLSSQNPQLINSVPHYSTSFNGSDTIIGIIDTGIWPESASFDDTDMSPIPSQWRGECMEGTNFTSSNCNRKLIGARYYSKLVSDTPRDEDGHGTHVASTAAGAPVPGASYYGLAQGTAKGGSPKSRIAAYRVCSFGGCDTSAILKAMDDAIADGVNIMSLSLGYGMMQPFDEDPIAIGALHAVEKGITVVCSAGNSGSRPMTVENGAPWIVTVGATTVDRLLEADVVLGGNMVIKGGGINFSNLSRSPVYPLIDGKSARSNSSGYSETKASYCFSGSLDGDKVKGKIVVCDEEVQYTSTTGLFEDLKGQGAIGVIVINSRAWQVTRNYGTRPIAAIRKQDAAEIMSYINSTSNPVATILPTVTAQNLEPAPVVAYFSSRGPTQGIKNLLKPDVTAPGVAILAAWPSDIEEERLPGKEVPLFAFLSGTSMSCPHVSGLAATIKSQHPTWSPSAIRSAIMTTGACMLLISAITTDNTRGPITAIDGSIATPYDIGAGEIRISEPLRPGLVYETEMMDYYNFLCDLGYSLEKIKKIALELPSNFSCPADSSPDGVSNMNYPSIAVTNLKLKESKTVIRTVTNVGEEDSVYTAAVEKPANFMDVEVVPSELKFKRGVSKLSFKVIFKLNKASSVDLFGSITWSNNKYKVRSPFVVSME